MIRTAFVTCPCRLPLNSRAVPRTPRTYCTGTSAMSKQDKAAEIIRDTIDAKIGETGANLKGTPEEVAERLIKEDGTAEELKQRELERKGAEYVPGVVGSGLERGEPAAIAQSAVDRASNPKEGATVMPEAAEKAKDMLVEEIRDARYH